MMGLYSRFDLRGGGDALPFGFWVMTIIRAVGTHKIEQPKKRALYVMRAR